MRTLALCALFISLGCSEPPRYFGNGDLAGTGGRDMAGTGGGDMAGNPQQGCGTELAGCYTVYAHSDHVLYHIDLANKLLVTVGNFNAPKVGTSEDIITDLAVAPDNTIWAISNTNLYNADPNDGHVTLVGPVTACGVQAVALSFTPDGNLYAGDFKGAFCHIDITAKPPAVTQIGTLGGNLALSGDLVAVQDGTVYGSAYSLSDASGTGTQIDNYLVKLDPSSGKATATLGKTGYPKLFGVAFAEGKVFGFTHDGSGNVVTIDPTTGVGTLYNSFMDPSTGKGISFAGAAVNSMVSPTIM
jgi:hypothetical protein